MSRSLALLTFASAVAAPLSGTQFVTSLGASAVSVRNYAPGGNLSVTGQAVTIAPRIEFRGIGSTVILATALSMFEVGDFSLQGGPRLYAVSQPVAGPFRFGVEASLDGTIRSDSPWTASAGLVGEAVLLANRGGVAAGVGVLAGGLEGLGPTNAGQGRFRGWNTWGRLEALASIQPVWLPDATYTDMSIQGGMLWRSFEFLGAAFVRFGTGVDNRGALQGAVRYYVNPLSALEIAIGSYLADPIQGLPAGSYLTAGFRVFSRAPRASYLTPLTGGVYEVDRSGVTLEFTLRGARTVDVAGDWNGWNLDPMESVGEGRWRVVIPLAPGLYHFNLLVDGEEWIVPDGVPSLEDGFGGRQGVIIVM